jgi:outer membrane protein assembly factor BamB
MNAMRLRQAILIPALCAALGGCGLFDEGGWFGPDAKQPIAGERIAILGQDRSLEPDPRLASLDIKLPDAVINEAWPQPGGTPSHAMQSLAVDGYKVAWRRSVGDGTSRSGRVSSPPIVAEGKVFTIDAGTQVTAVDAQSGSTVWTFDFEPEKDSAGGVGGGLTYDRGRLYVATGFAQVIALEADKGTEQWRVTLSAPLRAGPSVSAERVYAITIDNQIHALDIASGRKLWAHSGITEVAGLYGSASPALEGNTVIAAYSSGEIFALRGDNGRVLWSDSLAGVIRSTAISALSDIRGLPVVDRGQVFATSYAGRMVSIDLRSGGRIWDQNVGSLGTPWVAGDFIFLTTLESELACISRRDGRVRWVKQLQRLKDEKKPRSQRVIWTAPVLAGNKLFLANSLGTAVVVSPETGEIESTLEMPGGVLVTPIIANRTIYVLTDDADLVAIR